MAKFTAKQQKFVDEYLIDNNASRAALAAGYSKKTAYRTGSENLQKPQIKAEIDNALAKQSERTQISADRVLKELARVGFANMQDFIARDGRTTDIHSLNKHDSAAIKDYEEGIDGGTKIRLHDKMKALDSLAKHFKLFDADGANLEAPSLKIFIQGADGVIQPVGANEIEEGEETPGILITEVDASIKE